MKSSRNILLGKKLRVLRRNEEMKQGELAVLLDLSGQQKCSRLENGYKNFSNELISKLLEIFGISAEEFLEAGKAYSSNSSKSAKKVKKQEKEEIEKDEISQLLLDIEKVQNDYTRLQMEIKIMDLETEVGMLKEVFRLK